VPSDVVGDGTEECSTETGPAMRGDDHEVAAKPLDRRGDHLGYIALGDVNGDFGLGHTVLHEAADGGGEVRLGGLALALDGALGDFDGELTTGDGFDGAIDAVERLDLTTGDSRAYLAAMADPPDVIYLDPMFVSKNRTARPKKELWALARLVRDDDDGASLLAAALATGCRRIVVKRPDNGPPLEAPDGREPNTQFRGKTVRFDVYLQPEAVTHEAPATST
jgi:hypothetical protein